jgi:hypothetical protein
MGWKRRQESFYLDLVTILPVKIFAYCEELSGVVMCCGALTTSDDVIV